MQMRAHAIYCFSTDAQFRFHTKSLTYRNYMHRHLSLNVLGAVSKRKTVLPGIVIPMFKIRRHYGRLIFNMEITKRRLDGRYIETGPWSYWSMYIALAYPLILNITAGPLPVPKQIRLIQYNGFCGSAPNIHGVPNSELAIGMLTITWHICDPNIWNMEALKNSNPTKYFYYLYWQLFFRNESHGPYSKVIPVPFVLITTSTIRKQHARQAISTGSRVAGDAFTAAMLL